MGRNYWIVAGCTGLLGLGVGMAVGLRAEQPSQPLPNVSAPPPASELVDLTDVDPVERIVPNEPVLFYQYIDETGAVQFVSTLHEVPEAWRERAGQVELAGVPPTSPASARMQRKLAVDREPAATP